MWQPAPEWVNPGGNPIGGHLSTERGEDVFSKRLALSSGQEPQFLTMRLPPSSLCLGYAVMKPGGEFLLPRLNEQG